MIRNDIRTHMNCEKSYGFFMCGLFSKKDVWVYGRNWLFS